MFQHRWCRVNLAQVLEIAVQITQDWVQAPPPWSPVELSLCQSWNRHWQQVSRTWSHELHDLRRKHEHERGLSARVRFDAWPLVAEVVATDLVVRLWGCCWSQQVLTMAVNAELHPEGQPGSLGWREPVSGVLDEALSLRQALLELLVSVDGRDPGGTPDLDRLRCSVERWTDRLTGTLAVNWGLEDFCVHPERALAFGAERRLWTGAERPVGPWECDLLEVRAGRPLAALSRGAGDELRRGVLCLLGGNSRRQRMVPVSLPEKSPTKVLTPSSPRYRKK